VTEALLVHGPAFGKSPGGSILSDREKAMNASSLGHIDGSEPPFLIMHGSGDRLVSPMQSAHLAQALRKAGTDVEYVLVEGAGHGDLPWFQKPVIERVVKFFEKRLGSPAKDAAEGNNL
jgi:dipeptidyl aminopeptidase/acylaminoacyl peptidase